MFSIIGWVVLGLIAGAIAKAIMPGRDPGGWFVTMVIGIVGSLIGGFIGRAIFHYGAVDDAGGISHPGFLMSLVLAIVGSVVLLGIYRLVMKGRSGTALHT